MYKLKHYFLLQEYFSYFFQFLCECGFVSSIHSLAHDMGTSLQGAFSKENNKKALLFLLFFIFF